MPSQRQFFFAAALALVVACDPNVLDSTFGDAGSVSLGDGNGFAPVVLGLQDGAVSTGRSNQLLTRLDFYGKIDPTWGALIPADIRTGVTLTKTPGGILVAGLDDASRPRLFRVRDDGTADPSFTNGTVVLPEAVTSIGVAPVGSDVSLGFIGQRNTGTSVGLLTVLKLWTDGSVVSRTSIRLPELDPPAPGIDVTVNGVTTTPLGIVVAANVHYINVVGPTNHPYRWSYLLRFHVDGTLDTSFGGRGIVQPTYSLSPPASISAVTRQVVALPDGRVASIGELSYFYDFGTPSHIGYFLQLNRANGSQDASFGVNGVVYWTEPSDLLVPAALAASSQGTRLFVAGMRVTADATKASVAAYDVATGALATDFGAGGYATVPRAPSSLSLPAGQSRLYVGSFVAGAGATVSRMLLPAER